MTVMTHLLVGAAQEGAASVTRLTNRLFGRRHILATGGARLWTNGPPQPEMGAVRPSRRGGGGGGLNKWPGGRSPSAPGGPSAPPPPSTRTSSASPTRTARR